MFKLTLLLTTMFLALALTIVCIGETAYAHTAEGFSNWKVVHNTLVRHKHVATGTVCETINKNGTLDRFKLVSLNANNRDCTG